MTLGNDQGFGAGYVDPRIVAIDCTRCARDPETSRMRGPSCSGPRSSSRSIDLRRQSTRLRNWGTFDLDRNVVGRDERDKNHHIERGESFAHIGQLAPAWQPLEALAGADNVQVGEEVERASIENHIVLTSMSENQLAAFHELIFEVGCRCPVGERHASQLEKPIGLPHALVVAIHGYEVVDQRRLAGAMRIGHRNAHGALVSRGVYDADLVRARIADQPALWSTGSAILSVGGYLERVRDRSGAEFQMLKIRITDRLRLSQQAQFAPDRGYALNSLRDCHICCHGNMGVGMARRL